MLCVSVSTKNSTSSFFSVRKESISFSLLSRPLLIFQQATLMELLFGVFLVCLSGVFCDFCLGFGFSNCCPGIRLASVNPIFFPVLGLACVEICIFAEFWISASPDCLISLRSDFFPAHLAFSWLKLTPSWCLIEWFFPLSEGPDVPHASRFLTSYFSLQILQICFWFHRFVFDLVV